MRGTPALDPKIVFERGTTTGDGSGIGLPPARQLAEAPEAASP
ncbi:hypothetical protein [Streptomyces spiralis]